MDGAMLSGSAAFHLRGSRFGFRRRRRLEFSRRTIQVGFFATPIKEGQMAGKFELKKATNGQFHFNLKAGNGEVILSSGMYKAKADAENGIASVQKNAADEARFERKTSAKGEPFFVLSTVDGEVIGRSEMYASAASMEGGIASVKKNAADAKVVDLSEQV
jgi:uncharacterized protein YegP (UPF0339 family)